jgi:hypothetical protein
MAQSAEQQEKVTSQNKMAGNPKSFSGGPKFFFKQQN